MIDSCVLVLIGWDREPDHVCTHGKMTVLRTF